MKVRVEFTVSASADDIHRDMLAGGSPLIGQWPLEPSVCRRLNRQHVGKMRNFGFEVVKCCGWILLQVLEMPGRIKDDGQLFERVFSISALSESWVCLG